MYNMKAFFFILLIGLTAVFGTVQAQEWDFELDKPIERTKMYVKLVGDIYTLVPVDDESKRYVPANLPEAYQQEGMQLRVEGVTRKVPANVRMAGTPLDLTVARLKGRKKKWGVTERQFTFAAPQ